MKAPDLYKLLRECDLARLENTPEGRVLLKAWENDNVEVMVRKDGKLGLEFRHARGGMWITWYPEDEEDGKETDG